MDKSKLPKMGKGKVIAEKKKTKKQHPVKNVLDIIKTRNQRLKEAAGD